MTKRPMPREKRKDSKQQKKIVAAEISEAVVHGEAVAPLQSAAETKAAVKPKAPALKSPPPKPLAAKPATARLTVPKAPAPKVSAKVPAPARVMETPPARMVAAKTPLSETPAARAVVSAAAPEDRAAPTPQLMEKTVERLQSSLEAAGKGAVAVNHKLLDIAQENVNSSLELARDMVGATTPFEVMRLQMSWLHACVEALENHAKDLRALSAELVTSTSKPLREQLRK